MKLNEHCTATETIVKLQHFKARMLSPTSYLQVGTSSPAKPFVHAFTALCFVVQNCPQYHACSVTVTDYGTGPKQLFRYFNVLDDFSAGQWL